MKITHLLIGGIDSTRNELLSELVLRLRARNSTDRLRLITHKPSDVADMCRAITEVHFEMEIRLRTSGIHAKPIFALALYDIHRLKESKCYDALRKLESIAAKGRGANIHLIYTIRSTRLKKFPRSFFLVSSTIAFLTATDDDSMRLIGTTLASKLSARETYLLKPSPCSPLRFGTLRV